MDDAKERFSRSDLLFGENCAAELALKRVLIVGVGGVGGHAAENGLRKSLRRPVLPVTG